MTLDNNNLYFPCSDLVAHSFKGLEKRFLENENSKIKSLNPFLLKSYSIRASRCEGNHQSR